MAQVKIEMDSGLGWETRQEGDCETTAAEVTNLLPGYAIQYPHRAFVDGVLVATAERPHGARGNVRMVQHVGG